MKSASLAVLAGASAALAQAPAAPAAPTNATSPTGLTDSTGSMGISISPEQIAQYALTLLSNSCRTTVEQLVNTSSPLYSCLQIETLLPAITTNESVIPFVDEYLADVCYSNPCSTATLNATAQQIVDSCTTDLQMFGIDNQTVFDVVGLYPLAREVACLKSTDPSSDNSTMSTGSTLYNTTNGTFCITDLATELQTYLGANLTNAYIDTAALGGNGTALQLLANISATELCNDCIFAAVDLIASEYPEAGNYAVGPNMTISDWLEGTCPAYEISTNGTLPSNITEAALNSTFPETVIAGSVTYTPGPDTVSAPTADASAMGPLESAVSMASMEAPSAMSPPTDTAASAISAPSAAAAKRTAGSMEEKKRWVGEW